MKLDLVALGLVAFFGVLGLVSGAVRQVAHMAGVAAGYFAAQPIGAALGPFAAKSLRVPPVVGIVGCSVLGFFGIYVLAHVVAHFVVKRMLGERDTGALDRVGGGFIGVAKAALIVWVIASGMVLVEATLGKVGLRFFMDTKRSFVASFAKRHNLLTLFGFPGLDGLTRVIEAAKNPQAAGELLKDPAVQAFAKDARIQQIVHDEKLSRAILDGDAGAVLQSPKVMELLNDPTILEKLRRFE